MNVVARALIGSASTHILVRPVSYSYAGGIRSFARTISNASFPGSLRDLAEALNSSKDLPSIHLSCSALAAEVKNSHVGPPTSLTIPDNDRFLSILHLLSVSGRTEDWRRIEEILRDFYPVFGMTPSTDLYSSMLLRLANEGHHQQALELLLKMPQLPGQLIPSLDQVHLVLETSGEKVDFRFMENFVANMRRIGQRPTTKTFSILFHAYSRWNARENTLPNIDELALLIKEYFRQGLTFEPAIGNILYQIYASIGQLNQAEEIRSIYRSASNTSRGQDTPEQGQVSGSGTRTMDAARSSLRGSKSYADLKKVSQRLGVQCTVEHYTIVINNCIRSGNFNEAFHIYAKSKEAGVTPDSPLIAPLLRVLSREGGSDRSIDKAMAMYRDVADAHLLSPSSTHSSGTLDDHSLGPDAAIYDRLFRMLLSSSNSSKCLPIIETLLDEMKSRGFPVDTNSTGTVQIMLEMRQSQNFSEALHVYREHRDQLTEHGFHAILQEYCRMSFVGDLEVPLITQYFSIVNDMRLRQVPITSKVYTIILHHIGIMATKIKQARFDEDTTRPVFHRLVSTTRRVHDYLTLDASISPDAILWNQLMNTYQRLGCFADACRLWEIMYLTRRFDQISVNIMLDACGYAGHLNMANSLRSKLAKTGFALDLRNWNTWVECLCRNGKFDDAVNVVCSEMGRNGMEPDVESVRLLSKFARRNKEPSDFLLRIEESLPQLWNILPREIKNS